MNLKNKKTMIILSIIILFGVIAFGGLYTNHKHQFSQEEQKIPQYFSSLHDKTKTIDKIDYLNSIKDQKFKYKDNQKSFNQKLKQENDNVVHIINNDYTFESNELEKTYDSNDTLTALNENKKTITNRILLSKTSFNDNQIKDIKEIFTRFDKDIENLKERKEKELQDKKKKEFQEQQQREQQDQKDQNKIINLFIGHGFEDILLTYDGQDINSVMEKGGPQNLTHDGVTFYQIIDRTTCKITKLGSYAYIVMGSYHFDFTKHVLVITDFPGTSSFEVPYTFENNQLSFGQHSNRSSDGHEFIFEFVEDPHAIEEINGGNHKYKYSY